MTETMVGVEPGDLGLSSLEHIDFCLGLSHDVWLEHLFAYFSTNHLLKLRLIKKSLSQLVWYFLCRFKTVHSIRVGVNNSDMVHVVNRYLIKLQRLSSIRFEDYGALSCTALSDLGLKYLGKLHHVERLDFSALEISMGACIKEWVESDSPLLRTVQELKMFGIHRKYLNLFQKFTNLKTLCLEDGAIDLEMDDVTIGLPHSLTSLNLLYAINPTQLADIVKDCPNLTELSTMLHNLDDESISLALSSLKKLKKLHLKELDQERDHFCKGSFYRTFQNQTFQLTSLELPYFFTGSKKVTNQQKSLASLSLSLDSLKLNIGNSGVPNISSCMNDLVSLLSKLTNLTALSLHFPSEGLGTFEGSLGSHQKLKNLKDLTIEYFGGHEIMELVEYLTVPTLEKFKLVNYDCVDLDISFLKECKQLKSLEMECGGTTESCRDMLEYYKTLENTPNSNFQLNELFGFCFIGELIEFIPTTITKLELESLTFDHLVHIKEFKNLKTLVLNLLDIPIESFEGFTFPRSLKVLKFDSCNRITGLEPGFIDSLLPLRLDTLEFRCDKLTDEFVKRYSIIGDEEIRLLIFYRCNQLTNHVFEHLKKFTNCNLLVLQFCENVQYSNEYSMFQHENPYIGIISNEEEKQAGDPLAEYTSIHALYQTDRSSVVSEFETKIKDLISSKQYYLSCIHIDSFLSTTNISACEDEKKWDIYFNFIKTFEWGSVALQSMENISTAIDQLNGMIETTFRNDPQKLKDFLHVLSKSLDLFDVDRFVKAATIQVRHGHYTDAINILSTIQDMDGDIQKALPLVKEITTKILDGTIDIFEFNSMNIFFDFLDTLVECFPNNNNLDLIHHLMKIEFFKYHEQGLEHFEEMAKSIKEGDDFNAIEPFDETTEAMEVPSKFRDGFLKKITFEIPKFPSKIYQSEPFQVGGYLWAVKFLPKGEENGDNCTVYLSLLSTVPEGQDQEGLTYLDFDKVQVDFMFLNYDFNPNSYQTYSHGFKFSHECFGGTLPKEYYQPLETFNENDTNLYQIMVGIRFGSVSRNSWFLRNKVSVHIFKINEQNRRKFQCTPSVFCRTKTLSMEMSSTLISSRPLV